ncbi:MAG TPA: hypothetical protein VMG59_02435 [Phycisphaerae bacterium]|nr:hypothetical protein [Phycisphaerae bacterium]
MTENVPQPTEAAAAGQSPQPVIHERTHSFTGIMLRELRYLAAMLVTGMIFFWIAGKVLPSPDVYGSAVLAQGPAAGFSSELAMLVGLFVCILIGLWITFPDTPHAGLFCTTVGLIGTAVYWGKTQELFLAYTRFSNPNAASACRVLAVQDLFWIFFVLAGELFTTVLSRWFSDRMNWPELLGLSWPGGNELAPYPRCAAALTWGRQARGRWWVGDLVADVAGLLITGAVAMGLLYILLQSQLPGQVIFALFAAFAAGAFLAGLIVPGASNWAIWVAVPAVAGLGYLIAANHSPEYPGQASFFLARALPIYYASAGWAGAIIGFYSAIRIHYGTRLDGQSAS